MLPVSWKPILTTDLIRLGSPNDGGYVVSRTSVQRSSLLLSFGLNDDWTFEADFLEWFDGRAICYDPSVTTRFWYFHALRSLVRGTLSKLTRYWEYRRFFTSERAEHRKVRIGYNGPGAASLATILSEFEDRNIFLKVDIEGSEYRILNDIVENSDRLTGIAIEMHDIDLHRARICDFVQRLRDFRIIELHGNNGGGLDPNGDPLVVEFSFCRVEFVETCEAGVSRTLSAPNNPEAVELELIFAP